ncbi:GGDEF domain-containing protein [Schaalia sp. JY-X169]|uniref:bifunctional diguanylate cyclase/phosphodiesterase n=1 Tax=Schaalia sp. JY-X169 TaxID=2758572 RepID=UPI0015F35827|nr:GGDEF domain-containing protein [Schaalia sp. JY-X169]
MNQTVAVERRNTVIGWVWIMLSICSAVLALYAQRAVLEGYVAEIAVIVLLGLLVGSLRFSVGTVPMTLTMSLSPMVLSVLYPGQPGGWALFGVWVLAILISCLWSLRSIPETAAVAVLTTVSSAVVICLRGAVPTETIRLIGTDSGGQFLSVALSIIGAFIAALAVAYFAISLQVGASFSQLATSISWSRIVGSALGQSFAGVCIYGLSQWLAQTFSHAGSPTLFAITAGLSLAVVATIGFFASARRQHHRVKREKSLLSALEDIPWAAGVPVAEQMVQRLQQGLPYFDVSLRPGGPTSHKGSYDGRFVTTKPLDLDQPNTTATVRRRAFGRPFTLSDRRYIEAINLLAQESLRSEREVSNMRSIANTDVLTHLPNYRALRAELTDIDTDEDGPGLTGLLYLQLGDLHLINQNYSPETGDHVLQSIGRRLGEITREVEGATAYRIAGDEFAVLMVGLATSREAEQAAWKIHRMVESPVETSRGLVAVTFGQTLVIANNDNPQERARLVSLADKQLLEARRKYVNMAVDGTGYTDGSSMDELVNSGGPTAALVQAIRDDQLRQVYQPIVDRETGKIVALEAIVRFTDAGFGALPVAFLYGESARLGLRATLSRQILEHSVADMSRFRALSPDLRRIQVNITPTELVDHEFTVTYERLRAENPDLEIVLELEASDLMVSPVETRDKASAYARQNDVHIALDDTGTNYSELSALLHYPVRSMKLAANLLPTLSALSEESPTWTFLDGLRTSGLEIIAGDVTAPEEVPYLDRLHVNIVQGPLFGNPVSATEFLTRLDTIGATLG